jgi:hypothetical protein
MQVAVVMEWEGSVKLWKIERVIFTTDDDTMYTHIR